MALNKIFTENNTQVIAAINGCLKAIEDSGITSQEAQRIPEYLEYAIGYENARQLKAVRFKAPELVYGVKENGFKSFNRLAD